MFFAVLVFCIGTITAQTNKAWPVKAGEVPKDVLPKEAIYVLPAFTNGTAFFRNGASVQQRFNYNFLLNEMHFLGEKGDTLAIADPSLIKSVVIDTLMFYYDQGFFQEFFRSGNYKLAFKQAMVQVADKTRGAYDAASGTSAIKTYGTIYNSGSLYQLQVKKDVWFQGVTSFYIGNAYQSFLKATKKNFHLLFGEKNISIFIQEHKTNFNKAEDLKALLLFCVQ